MTALPAVVRESDIDRHADRRVEVRGVYTPLALGRRADRVEPPAHVAVRLIDGTLVLLEPPWHYAARRAATERSNHDGRPVRVVGTLRSTVPEEFVGAQTPLLPCLVEVESVAADTG